MANNRMVMVCNVCVPKGKDWNYNDKGVMAIAKWYPAGGFIAGERGAYYFRQNKQEWADMVDKFFDEHQHKEIASQNYSAGVGQDNPVRIEYESESLPLLEVKNKK